MTRRSPFRIVTRLFVFDFPDDAQAVTDVLGVQPSETWRSGDRVHHKTINVHHENGWMRQSPVDEYDTTPEAAVTALLATFSDPTAFSRLPGGSHVQLTVTLYGYTERPYFFLSSEQMRQLADIGADLDIDIYDLTSVEE